MRIMIVDSGASTRAMMLLVARLCAEHAEVVAPLPKPTIILRPMAPKDMPVEALFRKERGYPTLREGLRRNQIKNLRR